jgi:hypothetical protein
MSHGESDDALLAAADQHWLAVGLRMGLEQPDDARRLLARIERPWQGAVATGASVSAETLAAVETPASAGEPDAGEPDADEPHHPDVVATSMLLVRSAHMSAAQIGELGPDIVWGWVARLAPSEISLIGRVVQQMLDEGATPNAGRGFGIAWTDGVHIPAAGLDGMFREFVDLEMAVASIFAGRDLRLTTPTPESKGLAGMLHGWLGRPDPSSAEVGNVIERAGKPAQMGLVALWNAWVGIRYRESIPDATFEMLVRPWTTVVGPLPSA